VLSEQAPAKLNLGLHVLRRRADGFHDLETAFLPLGWADRLAAEPAGRLSLTCSDPALPTDEGNLVVRAALALRPWAGVERGAQLRLDKRVPYGAGLGSGSSDAAAALRLLVRLWELDVPEPDLHRIALGLGSDVPFSLDGRPALATGRGERLVPLLGADGEPYRCPFWLVVAVPPVHVSTAGAYGLVTPDDGGRPDLGAAVRSSDLERWRAEVVNDFQAPVEAAHPEVRAARLALVASGAGYASLSGSGSAVFGAFESEGPARLAADALAGRCRVWVEPPADG
jgi:4-diphosphocytidyl-2-C-methyl-D-erythritol kinase